MNLKHEERVDLDLIVAEPVPICEFESPQEQARLWHLEHLGLVRRENGYAVATEAGRKISSTMGITR